MNRLIAWAAVAVVFLAPGVSHAHPGKTKSQHETRWDYYEVYIRQPSALDLEGAEQHVIPLLRIYDLARQSDGSADTFVSDENIMVPAGWTWTIRTITFSAGENLSTSEECRVGLSIDETSAYAFLAGTAIDVGGDTTLTADDTNATGSINVAGETAVLFPNVVLTAGQRPYFLRDLAATGTGTCDGTFRAIAIQVEIEKRYVGF